MSWNANTVGRASAVKEALAKQFEQAKKQVASIPEEVAAVEGVEAAVNASLDLVIAGNKPVAVNVSASGSCSKSSDGNYPNAASINLQFTTVYGFVE